MASEIDLLRKREYAKTHKYEFLKKTVFDSNRPMYSVGTYDIKDILIGSLVGLYSKYQEFIDSRIEWMQMGVDNNEEDKIGRLNATLALAKWFRDEEECIELWKVAADNLAEQTIHDYKSVFARESSFAKVILFYAHAHEYEKVIEYYEEKYEKKEYKPSAITSLHRLVYAIALHKTKGLYTVEQLQKASIKALSKKIENYWLAKGHYTEGVMVLKLAWWDLDKSIKPLSVVYKTYMYLSHTPFPLFVNDILEQENICMKKPKFLDVIKYKLAQVYMDCVIKNNTLHLKPDNKKKNFYAKAVEVDEENYMVSFDDWHKQFNDMAEAVAFFMVGANSWSRLKISNENNIPYKWELELFEYNKWEPKEMTEKKIQTKKFSFLNNKQVIYKYSPSSRVLFVKSQQEIRVISLASIKNGFEDYILIQPEDI